MPYLVNTMTQQDSREGQQDSHAQLAEAVRIYQYINIKTKSIDIMPATTNPIPANKNSFIFCLGGTPMLWVT